MRREVLLGVSLIGAVGCCAVGCGSRTGLEPPSWFGSAGSSAEGGTSRGGSNSGAAAGVTSGGSAIGGSAFGGAGGSGGLVLGGFGGAAGSAGAGGAPACNHAPSDEVCNGVDDDCDGEIDEGLDLGILDGPSVVRLDEGATDVGLPIDCASCRWAWVPQLVAPGGKLGMVWYLGLFGGSEQANGFYRRLSATLAPESPVTSLGPQFWLGTLRPAQNIDAGSATALATIQHVAQMNQPVFTRLDSDYTLGATTSLDGCSAAAYGDMIGQVMPSVVACASPGLLHTFSVDTSNLTLGQRGLISVRDNDTDKRDVAGRAVGALEADNTGVIAIPVTTNGFGKATELWTIRVNSNGLAIGDPNRRVLAPYSGLILEGLFATSSGFLLFGDYRGAGAWPRGRFVVTLDQDGAVSSQPGYFDEGELEGFDQVAVTRDGAEFVMALARGDRLTIEQLDETGMTRRSLDVVSPAYSEPSLLHLNGSIYVGYAEPPDAQKKQPNRVMALRLGCAP